MSKFQLEYSVVEVKKAKNAIFREKKGKNRIFEKTRFFKNFDQLIGGKKKFQSLNPDHPR